MPHATEILKTVEDQHLTSLTFMPEDRWHDICHFIDTFYRFRPAAAVEFSSNIAARDEFLRTYRKDVRDWLGELSLRGGFFSFGKNVDRYGSKRIFFGSMADATECFMRFNGDECRARRGGIREVIS